MIAEVLKKDETLSLFVRINKIGPKEITLEDLQQDVSNMVLNSNVPEEVKKVFEAAKDLCLFGYFRYYFFSISNHYAFLSLESALRNKYKQLFGEPKKFIPLPEIIKGLKKKKFIKEDDKLFYETSVKLRNYFSHLTSPLIVTPGMSLSTLEKVRKYINRLF